MSANPNIVSKVIGGGKADNLELGLADLQELSKEPNKQALIEEAKKLTEKELNQLKARLEEERVEQGTGSGEDEKELEATHQTSLQHLETSLNAITPAPSGGSVSDIAEKPKGEQNILEKAQNFLQENGLVGMIAKTWISVQKGMAKMFPSKEPLAQAQKLQAIEELYARWCGPGEAHRLLNKTSPFSAVTVVAGTQDEVIYMRLHADYEKVIQDKAGAVTGDLLEAQRRSYSFDTYLLERRADSMKKMSLDPTKRYITTLKGIAGNEKPQELTA